MSARWLQAVLASLAVALALGLGWLTDWGRGWGEPASPSGKIIPKAELGGLLPDFRISADATAYGAVSEKPLFNPTRRPAPTAPVAVTTEPPKPQIRRGLYQLVGVTDLGTVKIAQVKETNGARTHSVRQGDMLQELRVTEITSDRVTLAFAGETDVLTLPKFTASGRVPQPPAPPPSAQTAAAPPAVAQPQPAIAAQPGQAIPPPQAPAAALTSSPVPSAGAAPPQQAQNQVQPLPGQGQAVPQSSRDWARLRALRAGIQPND